MPVFGPARHQGGSITAEFAVVLPCVVVLIAVVAAAGAGARAQLQCHDAAWTAARLAARGEAPHVVAAAAHAVGPRGTTLRITELPQTVTASVVGQVAVGPPGWTVPVSCSATAWREVLTQGPTS